LLIAAPECDIAAVANEVCGKSFLPDTFGGLATNKIFLLSVLLGIHMENRELVLDDCWPSTSEPFGVPLVVLLFWLRLCLEVEVSEESRDTGTEGCEGYSMWNMRTLNLAERSSIDSSYSSSSHPDNLCFFYVVRLNMLIVCPFRRADELVRLLF